MDHLSLSLELLRNHPVGFHGKRHDRAIDAVIGNLIKLIPSANNSNADSMVPELLNALSYYNYKCILTSPRPYLEHHFGVALLNPGNDYAFLDHDEPRLTRHGVELNHTWQIPGGTVLVEDSLLWEIPAGWQGAENNDARPVCHRLVVLRGPGEQPITLEMLYCIIFANDEGGLTTIPTGGFSLKAQRIGEATEELKDLTIRTKDLDAPEELVTDREAALYTAADVMDDIKESFTTRKEDLAIRELDLQAAKEDVIGHGELVTEREENLDSKADIMESRKENVACREELTEKRESELDAAEQALEVHEDYLAFRKDSVAEQEMKVQIAKKTVKKREHTVSLREESITAGQSEVRIDEDAVNARERDIGSREHLIEQRMASLDAAEIAIDRRHTDMDCREVDMDSREETMASREQEVKEREFEIEKARKNVAVREVSYNNLSFNPS